MTYGMGDQKKVGPVVFSEKSKGFAGVDFHEKDFSEDTARAIDEEVHRLIMEAESRCEKILKDKLALLKKISKDLLEKETLTKEEFLEYFG